MREDRSCPHASYPLPTKTLSTWRSSLTTKTLGPYPNLHQSRNAAQRATFIYLNSIADSSEPSGPTTVTSGCPNASADGMPASLITCGSGRRSSFSTAVLRSVP